MSVYDEQRARDDAMRGELLTAVAYEWFDKQATAPMAEIVAAITTRVPIKTPTPIPSTAYDTAIAAAVGAALRTYDADTDADTGAPARRALAMLRLALVVFRDVRNSLPANTPSGKRDQVATLAVPIACDRAANGAS